MRLRTILRRVTSQVTATRGQTIIALAASLAVAAANAQQGGTVNFGNHGASKVMNGKTGVPVTAEDQIRAALYWAPLGSDGFVQLGESVYVGVPLPGLFVGGTRLTGPATAGGASGRFQVRAWSGGYASYEDARQHEGELVGRSTIITNLTGDPSGNPPTPPTSLIAGGLAGFTVLANNLTADPPTISCATNKTVACGSAWVFDTPTAVDGCTSNSAPVSVLSTITNGDCPQVITRTWATTNSCDSNYATCSQVVTVENTSVPLLVCESSKTANCDTNWAFDVPAAVDPCTGSNLQVWVVGTVSNYLSICTQLMTRTWTVTNLCNTNTATCSQTITVTCSNCPVLAVTMQCPPRPVPPGGSLGFSGTVSNLGNVTLAGVTVVNDQPRPDTLVFGPASLAPGEGAQFTGSYRVPPYAPGPYVDTLHASGTSIYGGLATNTITTSCAGTNVYAPAGDMNGDGIVDQDELNAVLANYWASCPWVRMTNPASVGGGHFQFTLTNATGWNFTVMASTNLVDWADLPGPAYPVYQFYDPEAATNAPIRAYRLRWP